MTSCFIRRTISLGPHVIREGDSFFHFLACCTFLSMNLFAVGCSSSTEKQGPTDGNATPVNLALNWYAEAEHGGYILAAENGIYEQHGVNVEIQQGGPGAASVVIQELASGRISFAISNADLVVLARAAGVPLVAVAAPLQRSPRCVMVHQAAGMNSLQELQNVELAISDTRPFALWMKKQLPLKNVKMVPYSGQVREFLLKQNFAQQAYVFSEPFLAKEAGGDPQTLMLSEIGFNPYASLLVTTEQMLREQPDTVQAMVSASVAGWEKYLDNPTETNEAIHRDNPEMSVASLEYGATAMKPLCQPEPGLPLCGMTEQRWQSLIDQIVSVGAAESGTVNASECFSLRFLEAATHRFGAKTATQSEE